jgi:hypothetical protein
MKTVKTLTLLTICVTSIALADDFKTTNGKEYKDAKVTRVEPDGIMLLTKSGISKVYFNELPKELQDRFHYQPEQAAAYSGQQNAALEATQKQQEEAMRQTAEAAEKQRQSAGAQQAAQSLQARYADLQQQEQNLLSAIGQAKQPGQRIYNGRGYPTRYRRENPDAARLPALENQLDNVRDEKNTIKKQLEHPQR